MGTLSCDVFGRIDSNSKLSGTAHTVEHHQWSTDQFFQGTPDLQLTFTNPGPLGDPSFYPCVRLVKSLRVASRYLALSFCSCRLQRWKRDNALSFVPPDGKFTLMEYQYLPPTSRSLSAPSTQVPVPLIVKPTVTIEEDGGMLDHKHQPDLLMIAFQGPSTLV